MDNCDYLEKVYLIDSYAKEFDARVEGIDGNMIKLDKTLFYPTGGGQSCDTGIMIAGSEIYNVVETKKDGEGVLHIIDRVPNFNSEQTVHGKIDWEKRYMHMKLHTAIHILNAIMETKKVGTITGGQIYDNKARVDFDMPGMNKDEAIRVIAEAQNIVDEGRKVYPKILEKKEALAIENLSRTEPGRKLLVNLDKVRVIVIEGVDMQMDGGTHVSNTKEVGKIKFVKYENKGSHNKRVEIALV